MSGQVFQIKRVVVRPQAIDVYSHTKFKQLHVPPIMAALVLQRYPNLANHVCVNEKGPTFGDELVGTEMAHLFEHLALELMMQAEQPAPQQLHVAPLRGFTTWDEELRLTRLHGYAAQKTTLTFRSDLAAMAAIKQAAQEINELAAPRNPQNAHGRANKQPLK